MDVGAWEPMGAVPQSRALHQSSNLKGKALCGRKVAKSKFAVPPREVVTCRDCNAARRADEKVSVKARFFVEVNFEDPAFVDRY